MDEFLSKVMQAIIGALVVVALGLVAYFRQKEYERMQQRYLADGADAFGEQIDYLFSVFFANYRRGLWLIRLLRDTEKTMRRGLLNEERFLQFGPRVFDQTAQYRVKELVGSKIFSDVYERVHARVTIANDFIVFDLLNGLRYWLDPPVSGAPEFSEGWSQLSAREVFEGYFEKLQEYNAEVNSYFVVMGAVQNLSRELARGRFSVRKIDRFKRKDIVTRLNSELSELRAKLDEDKRNTPEQEGTARDVAI